MVPSAGGVREFAQASAVERRMAGGGDRDAGPGAGQRHDRLQHGKRRHNRRHGLAQQAACRRAGPSTWSGICTSGWRTGCRARRRAAAWSAGVSPTGDSQCLAGAATTGEPGALLRGGFFNSGALAGPLMVDGLAARRPMRAATSASVAPASHGLLGHLAGCVSVSRGWAGVRVVGFDLSRERD